MQRLQSKKGRVLNQGTQNFRQYLLQTDQSSILSKSRFLNVPIDPSVIEAINDQSFNDPKQPLLDRIAKFYSRFRFFIRPDNHLYICWQVLIMLIIIYYFLEIGLLLGFQDNFWQNQLEVLFGLNIFFLVVLFFDIIISPFKGYYDEGILISNIPLIFKKYFKLQFWIDIVGFLAILIPLRIGSTISNITKIFWIFKLYTGSRISKEFERCTQIYIELNTIYLILKLVIFCVFYAHFMGIFFYLVSLYVYNSNYYGPFTPMVTWVYNAWAYSDIVNLLPWYSKYAYVMYYGVAVVTTIAYGDITPKNPIECIYTIFILIIVTIFFGYILTEILRLLINVFSYSFQRRYHSFELNLRLKSELIMEKTQIQIKKNSQELDREEKYRNRQVQNTILKYLPHQIHTELYYAIYADFLKQIQLISPQESQQSIKKSFFIKKILEEVKENRYFVGDVLYEDKQVYIQENDNHLVYYTSKPQYANSILLGVGKTPQFSIDGNLIPNFSSKLSIEIHQISNCGRSEFLTGNKRQNWAVIVSNCILFVLSRKAFLTNSFYLTGQERENLALIKEAQFKGICLVCSENHHLRKCHLFSPFYSSQQILKSNRLNIRKMNSVRKVYKKNSLKQFKNIREIKFGARKDFKQNLMRYSVNNEYILEIESQLQDDYEADLYHLIIDAQIMIKRLDDGKQMKESMEEKDIETINNYRLYHIDHNVDKVLIHYQTYQASRKQQKKF